MEKLIDVKKGVRVGLRPDEVYSDDTVWADGENVVFSDGAVRPTLSQNYFLAQGVSRPITCIEEVLIAGERYLFWGNSQDLLMYKEGDAIENVNISGEADYALARNELWSITNWKSGVVATASADATTAGIPQKWQSGGALFVAIDLSSAPFGFAEIVAKLKVHLLFANTDTDPTSIFWCDADDITEWEPLATNSAGGLYIRSLKSPIMAVVPFQEVLGVYGTKSLYAVAYVGAPSYFTYSGPVLEGIGAVSKHAVVSVGRKHYGMSGDGIWVTDGFEYQYIDESFVHKTVYDNLNFDLLDIIVGWHDIAESMVVWFYPSIDATELDVGIGYNYVTGAWTKLSYARTFGTAKHVFNKALLGDSAGNIWQQVEKGGVVAPPPVAGIPIQPAMEVLYNYENGFGGLHFGSGGFGGLWGYDEDGNDLGPL
jgi:hypothetical protein